MPDDGRPDDNGVGCFILGILAGGVFAIITWATKDQPGGFSGLLGMLAMCGFFGALVAVGSEENAAKRQKRRR